MKTEIATVLRDFGTSIGLASTLDLSKDGTVRLNLEKDFAIDFEEDPNGKTIWIYSELFPGVDKTQRETLFELLRLMFLHHRSSDARLTIDPQGFQILLVSSFSCFIKEEGKSHVEQLDEHLKKFVALVETLRASVDKKKTQQQPNLMHAQLA